MITGDDDESILIEILRFKQFNGCRDVVVKMFNFDVIVQDIVSRDFMIR